MRKWAQQIENQRRIYKSRTGRESNGSRSGPQSTSKRPVIPDKDARDKRGAGFKTSTLQDVIQFLKAHDYGGDLSMKTLSAPSARDVQMIIKALIMHLDPNYVWGAKGTVKFEDEVLPLLKGLKYPYVDGQFSLRCYTEAVDACYKAYNAREEKIKSQSNGHANGNGVHADEDSKTPIDRFDYMAFHAPTCKLVSKSYARLLYNDYLNNPEAPAFKEIAPELKNVEYQASLTDKNVEKTFMALTKKRFAQRVQPAISVATMCGNMYCGSVYGGIVGLLSYVSPADLSGKKLGIFSYGSGLASSMFSLKVVGDTSVMKEKLNLDERLNSRKIVAPEVYDEMCLMREKAHLKKDFQPVGSTEDLLPGT